VPYNFYITKNVGFTYIASLVLGFQVNINMPAMLY
jgi:hypothetical protein